MVDSEYGIGAAGEDAAATVTARSRLVDQALVEWKQGKPFPFEDLSGEGLFAQASEKIDTSGLKVEFVEREDLSGEYEARIKGAVSFSIPGKGPGSFTDIDATLINDPEHPGQVIGRRVPKRTPTGKAAEFVEGNFVNLLYRTNRGLDDSLNAIMDFANAKQLFGKPYPYKAHVDHLSVGAKGFSGSISGVKR